MDFYTSISKYYNDVFPLNKAQLPFIQSCTTDMKNILDIGCGTGGLSIELSDIFNTVSAIDTNEQMLDIARNESHNSNIEFRVGGMLDVDDMYAPEYYNTVLCFGNTIVHLNNIVEISLFFKKVKKILAPEGKFLFQIINYDNILDNNCTGLPTIENDRIKFERNYSLNSDGKIDFSTVLTILETGEEINNNVELFPIRKNEVEKALVDAGFSTILAYSSFKKDPYTKDGLPLVFECC